MAEIVLVVETNRNTLIIVDYFYDGVNFSERYGITRQEYTVPAGTSTINYEFRVLPHRNTKTCTYLRIMDEDNTIAIIEIRYYIRDVPPQTSTPTATWTPVSTETPTKVALTSPTPAQRVIEPAEGTHFCEGDQIILKLESARIESICHEETCIYDIYFSIRNDGIFLFIFQAGKGFFSNHGIYTINGFHHISFLSNQDPKCQR